MRYLVHSLLFLIAVLAVSVESFFLTNRTFFKEDSSNRSHVGEFKRNKNASHFISAIFHTASTCNCVNDTCSCCAHVEFDRIHLNDTACVNLTYLSDDLGIKLTFDIDGVIYYEKTISAKNPPPLCFGVPYLKDGAKLCLKFYNLDWTNSTLSGCVDLVGYLLDVKVGTVKIGCFHLGNLTKSSHKSRWEFYHEVIIVNADGTNTNISNLNAIETLMESPQVMTVLQDTFKTFLDTLWPWRANQKGESKILN